MKLTRRPRREPPETIIALINVVFFLLVFFMVIGRMDATAPFELAPPLAVTGADMPGGGITLAIAATGTLALEGEPLDEPAALDAIAAALARSPAQLIRINAHRALPLHRLLPLVAAIESLGARDVVLVVTPEGAG